MSDLDAHRRNAIADFVSRVRAAVPHVVDIRLFGSLARHDAQPDSDIDILVVVQPDAASARVERQIFDIAFDVSLQNDLHISPLVLTSDMLAHPVWGQTPFMKNVRRESVGL